MTVHTFEPSHYHVTIGSHEPVLHIEPGDTVITTAIDARGSDQHGRQVASGPNPQTGPFFIDGAEPGDTLVMKIDRLVANRPSGFTRSTVAPNVVDPEFVRGVPKDILVYWDIDLEGGTARLQEPTTKLKNLVLPLAPMLGCFGVAPALGQAISTATSAEHGGNMDYRGFAAGVTVYLPVFVAGALLHVGDAHAVQGDGEIVGTGIEVSCEIEFTVDLIKNKQINWPRGENSSHIFTAGNARPLDQALQHATSEMIRWLGEGYGLDVVEASTILGQCVEYEVGNVFDPAYTMVCKLRKSVLEQLR